MATKRELQEKINGLRAARNIAPQLREDLRKVQAELFAERELVASLRAMLPRVEDLRRAQADLAVERQLVADLRAKLSRTVPAPPPAPQRVAPESPSRIAELEAQVEKLKRELAAK